MFSTCSHTHKLKRPFKTQVLAWVNLIYHDKIHTKILKPKRLDFHKEIGIWRTVETSTLPEVTRESVFQDKGCVLLSVPLIT